MKAAVYTSVMSLYNVTIEQVILCTIYTLY